MRPRYYIGIHNDNLAKALGISDFDYYTLSFHKKHVTSKIISASEKLGFHLNFLFGFFI